MTEENPLEATDHLLRGASQAQASATMRSVIFTSITVSFCLTVVFAVLLVSPWGKRALALAGADADVAEHQRTRLRGELVGELATSAAYQQQFAELREEAAANLETLEEEFVPLRKEWSTKVQDLETGAGGRDIAANPKLVEKFAELTTRHPPVGVNVDLMREKLSRIRDITAGLAAAPSASAPPDAATKAEIATATRNIQESLVSHSDSLDAIEALEKSAAKDDIPPSATTLAEALKNVRVEAKEQEIEAFVRRFSEALEKQQAQYDAIAKQTADAITELRVKSAEQSATMQREHEARMADLEREAQRLTQETEQKLVADATAKAAEEAKAAGADRAREKQAIADAATKKALIAKCNDVTIQHKLRFFLGKGILRVKGNNLKPEPWSYSELSASGALEKTDKGIQKLYKYASTPEDRDRPRCASVSSFLWASSDVRKELVEAQELLLELGPTLVELKMLNP